MVTVGARLTVLAPAVTEEHQMECIGLKIRDGEESAPGGGVTASTVCSPLTVYV